jgi:LDH2 family malate/lactate/ureidoglycolate dehydrogenase
MFRGECKVHHHMSPPTKRIILITGAPGAGKTEVAARVIRLCPHRSVWVDTDKLVSIHPFTIDGPFYKLLYANLTACLINYAAWDASVIVISGVIVPSGIYSRLRRFSLPGYLWRRYALTASRRSLVQRIEKDIKPQDIEQRKLWLRLNEEVRSLPGFHVIDTTRKRLAKVVETIARKERLLEKEPKGLLKSEWVRLEQGVVQAKGIAILRRTGTTRAVAEKVMKSILRNELEGYASHGLLRLKDYLQAIDAGELQVNSRPTLRQITSQVKEVNGCRGWGVLSVEAVVKAMQSLLRTQAVGIITMVNTAHIGRLARIAEPLARRNIVVIGFVNYLGAGQRVPVFGGSEARFCTNPVLIGIPTRDSHPVILDMTTSTAAEGRIREYLLKGERVPEGWLIDGNWNPVDRPELLYSSPPEAMIPPLGGAQAYKGAGLAFCAEIFAGILGRAGFVQDEHKPGGNGGFFIGVRMNSLGARVAQMLDEIRELIAYCRSSPVALGYQPFRYPGEKPAVRYARSLDGNRVVVARRTWETLVELELSTRK